MSESGFTQNVMKLAAGNTAAQLISIITIPIITRLYDPEQFGVYTIFLSIVALLAPVSPLQYQAAMVLPKDNYNAWLLRKVATYAVITLSTLYFIITTIIVLADFHNDFTKSLVLSGVVWLIAPTLLFQGMLLINTTWIMRYKAFGKAAVTRVWETVFDRMVGIGFGLLYPATLFLASGKLLGGVAGWWYTTRHAYRQSALDNSQNASPAGMVGRLAFRYRNFAIYSSMAVLVATAARELPVILLGAMFEPVIAAYYALSLRIVNMPMLTVGDAIAKAFFQHCAAISRNNENLAEPALRLLKIGLLIATPPLLLLAVHGQLLFGVIFGNRWTEAGIYVAILAPAFLTLFVSRPIASLFDVLEQQKRKLAWTTLNLLGRIAAIVGIAVYDGSVISAIFGITLATIISQIGAMQFLLRKAGVTGQQIWPLGARVVSLLMPVIIGIPLTAIFLDTIMAFSAAVALFLVQILLLIWFDKDIQGLVHRIFNFSCAN